MYLTSDVNHTNYHTSLLMSLYVLILPSYHTDPVDEKTRKKLQKIEDAKVSAKMIEGTFLTAVENHQRSYGEAINEFMDGFFYLDPAYDKWEKHARTKKDKMFSVSIPETRKKNIDKVLEAVPVHQRSCYENKLVHAKAPLPKGENPVHCTSMHLKDLIEFSSGFGLSDIMDRSIAAVLANDIDLVSSPGWSKDIKHINPHGILHCALAY